MLLLELKQVLRGGTGPVVEGEVGDENDDPDEGGPDLGGRALEDVFAEAGRVSEEDALTKPEPHLLGVAEVLAQDFVPAKRRQKDP